MSNHVLRIAAPNGTTRDIGHRGSTADVVVIQQIFVHQEYALSRLKRRDELLGVYDNIVRSDRKPLIVDAGANIGASAIWFALEFPDASIAAFEPERRNFRLLRQNTAGLPVEAHLAALGAHDGFVDVEDPGEGEWGYRTRPSNKGSVRRIGLGGFIREKVNFGAAPFICKIDIEGAEDDLFSADTDWVDLFPLLIVELHDWLLPKQGTSRSFLKTMSQRDRDFVYLGENVFSIRNDK